MIKVTRPYCLIAVLSCLTFSLSVAAEDAEAPPPKAEASDVSKQPSPSKEETTKTTLPQSNTTSTQKEPDCE